MGVAGKQGVGMVYKVFARAHAIGFRFVTGTRGQGTVEYVALILLVGAVLAGVVAATRGKQFGASGIAEAIVKQMKKALDTVQ